MVAFLAISPWQGTCQGSTWYLAGQIIASCVERHQTGLPGPRLTGGQLDRTWQRRTCRPLLVHPAEAKHSELLLDTLTARAIIFRVLMFSVLTIWRSVGNRVCTRLLQGDDVDGWAAVCCAGSFVEGVSAFRSSSQRRPCTLGRSVF